MSCGVEQMTDVLSGSVMEISVQPRLNKVRRAQVMVYLYVSLQL